VSAASQLDGTSDAITRATNAAMTTPLVQNDQTFAGDGPVSIGDIRFLSSLPPGSDPITSSNVTTDPLEARFVEVTTSTLTQGNIFIRAVGAAPTATTSTRAVAGFSQAVCRTAPVAICNPQEAVGAGAPFDADVWRGRQIVVKASGPSSSWVPGDFGLVDVQGVQSAPAIADMIASVAPSACVTARVDLKPGQTQGARQAFNTRFDMFENPFFGGNAAKSNPNYRPARNVTSGLVRSGGPCNYVEPSSPGQAMALPRDQNISSSNRFGNGVWNCASYWSVNHSSAQPPSGCTSSSSPASLTRYELYRHEIDNSLIPSNGAPMCYSGSTAPNDTPDRRVLYFAVINCLERGPISGNSAGPIPVEAFVKAFMTEPTGQPPEVNLYLEVIDIVQPGADDAVLHDIVQLYR
jgi:hypothetical protein